MTHRPKTSIATPRILEDETSPQHRGKPSPPARLLVGVVNIGKYLHRDPNGILILMKTYNLPACFDEGVVISYTDLLDEWTTSRVREKVDLDTNWAPIIKERKA